MACLPDNAERNELFLWGDTPLGLFHEPTSLNQLINEMAPESEVILDVRAIKNGSNFAVFVEKQTGFTF